MRLLDRYLFSQMLGPTVMATAALGAVGLLSQSLDALDIIIKQRQSAAVLLEITILALPQLLSMLLPISIFVAGLVALNRLHTEQEIVVCYASGVSRWRVIAPAMRLAVLATLATLVVNLWVAPFCERAIRGELYRIQTDLAATLVTPGQFVEPAKGLTVYAQDIRNGEMRNLFIVHEKPKGGDTTFIAQSGAITQRNGAPMLVLHNGSIQEFSPTGVLNYLKFSEYPFDLSAFVKEHGGVKYKVSDRYFHELLFPDLTQAWERANRPSLAAEANARLSSPLYNIAFMAMALAAVLGGPFSRLGYNRRILVVGAASGVVRILGVGAQVLCYDHEQLNALQYIVPLAATAWALRQIFKQKIKRRIPLAPLTGATLMPSAAE
jgi:lipopolysaccharide export system permease protein